MSIKLLTLIILLLEVLGIPDNPLEISSILLSATITSATRLFNLLSKALS